MTSLHHAREAASLSVNINFIIEMISNFNKTVTENYLLTTREFIIVPFVNPDSYIENENMKLPPGVYPFLRKNRRPTCSIENETERNSNGVDLNRNYDWKWKKSTSKCDQEYAGEYPFSEPETRAIKYIVEKNNFLLCINYHSYGSMLTHPWNYANNINDSKINDSDLLIYDELKPAFNWSIFGPAIETVGYHTNGESDDWLYGKHNIISFSPEVGPDKITYNITKINNNNETVIETVTKDILHPFWPDISLIDGILKRNYIRSIFVGHKAGIHIYFKWIKKPDNIPIEVEAVMAVSEGLSASKIILYNAGLSSSDYPVTVIFNSANDTLDNQNFKIFSETAGRFQLTELIKYNSKWISIDIGIIKKRSEIILWILEKNTNNIYKNIVNNICIYEYVSKNKGAIRLGGYFSDTPDVVEMTPGGMVDSTPGGMVDSTPGGMVDSTPGGMVDSTPRSMVDSTPGGIVDNNIDSADSDLGGGETTPGGVENVLTSMDTVYCRHLNLDEIDLNEDNIFEVSIDEICVQGISILNETFGGKLEKAEAFTGPNLVIGSSSRLHSMATVVAILQILFLIQGVVIYIFKKKNISYVNEDFEKKTVMFPKILGSANKVSSNV
eukprot:GHVL01020751.1.p1 GENE.GHVL01020751.1~~GHVL01020751.1.p1  ORF type:complete len:613 (+),score=209.20 GHVL01020751.1:254-2092(+)